MSDPIPQPEQPGHSVLTATFAYNAWANGKLLDFCANLDEAQLMATTVGTYGPLVATLVHTVMAEVSYVSRVHGKQPPTPLRANEFPGFAVLHEAVEWANAELAQLALEARGDTMVVEAFPEETVRYPLADLLVQAASHSMEHRTHVAAILTSLGMEPPDLSTWAWMEARGSMEITRPTPS